MDPDCAAAADGQEQLPEHATVASELPSYLPASQLLQVEAPASEYVPDTQLLQVEAPASEYLPATTSPSLSAHPQLLPMQSRVTPWHPAGVRSGAWACSGGLERGACLRGMVSRSTMNLLPLPTSTCLPRPVILTVSSLTAPPDAGVCHHIAPCWGAVGRAVGDWGACLRGTGSRMSRSAARLCA